MPGTAGHGAGGDERIQNGLLRGIGHGLEEQVDAILVEDVDVDQGRFLIVRKNIGRRKAERNVAAAVAPEGAEPCKADAGAANDALELPVAQRNVRGCNDDDRALLGGVSLRVGLGWGDDPAVGKAQVAGTPEVGQDENTQMTASAVEIDTPG